MEGHVLFDFDEARPPSVRERQGAAPALVTATAILRVPTTKSLEVVDLTPRVEAFLRAVGLGSGWINVQSRHTTAGILVNEHEPLLVSDLLAFLERLAPRGAGYAHDALHRRANVPPSERLNGHAHAKAALLATAESVNVSDGVLQLGCWQRVLLVELDGPRDRQVSLVALGSDVRP